MVHRLEIEYWGRIQFVYLDIDDKATKPFQDRFGFRLQPQLFLLDGEGNVVQEFAGRQPEPVLREALDRLLGM